MKQRLDTPVQYLKGVGTQRAALFSKLGVHSIRDLLQFFPRDYLDLSATVPIAEAPLYSRCAIRARIVRKEREQRIRSGLSIFKMQIADDSGIADVTMFNCRYTVETMKLDEEYLFFGKIGGTINRRELSAPMIFDLPISHTILPIYPQTAGLNSRLIRHCVEQCLDVAADIPDLLPPSIRDRYAWMDNTEAYHTIHFPDSLVQADKARARFIFCELLVLCCALSQCQATHSMLQRPPMQSVDISPFYAALPFSPTNAQRRCVDEAIADMCSATPMNRLIQGDVGSGKTMVAAACVYFVSQNGAQAVVMAPTELLAEQHLRSFSTFLTPFGLKVALLTSSTKIAERRRILAGLADGSIHLVVGTHSLLNEEVSFAHLDLVITDEQHRFGVAQRAKLSGKNEHAHTLVMSATPIPRTLSLIIYGDLKLSVIDELPPGRQPVETLVINGAKRHRALGFIRKALDDGRQAYLVCPLIKRGDVVTELKPAVEYKEMLEQGELQGYRVGLLHGKMNARDKEKTMRQFQSGEIQVLVSTTVVEVGIDVPNATIMLIENAERFGLSQLHQLRGRVGRGQHKSWCILVTDSRAEATRERMRVMKSTTDGFQIAEADLKLRGPGDFFGQRQHGLPELHVASLSTDIQIMDRAKQCAEEILQQDPLLSNPEHAALQQATLHMLRQVGVRPN